VQQKQWKIIGDRQLSQARSIRGNPTLSGLPDLRKPGAWLQVLLVVNLGALLPVLAPNPALNLVPFGRWKLAIKPRSAG